MVYPSPKHLKTAIKDQRPTMAPLPKEIQQSVTITMDYFPLYRPTTPSFTIGQRYSSSTATEASIQEHAKTQFLTKILNFSSEDIITLCKFSIIWTNSSISTMAIQSL